MRFRLLAAAIVFVTACGEQPASDENAPGTQGFQDHRSQVRSVNEAAFPLAFHVNGYLSFTSDFYLGEDSISRPIPEDCSIHETRMRARASGHHLVIDTIFTPDAMCDAERRATALDDARSGDQGIYAEARILEGQAILDCDKDVSPLDGQFVGNLDLHEVCGRLLSFQAHSKLVAELTVYRWANGVMQETRAQSDWENVFRSSEGGPCVYTYSGDFAEEAPGCIQGSYHSIRGLGDWDRSGYLYQLRHGLTADVHDHWYTSGTIDFEYHNWTGTLTYDAGGKPTWEASDGKTRLEGRLQSPVFGYKRFAIPTLPSAGSLAEKSGSGLRMSDSCVVPSYQK